MAVAEMDEMTRGYADADATDSCDRRMVFANGLYAFGNGRSVCGSGVWLLWLDFTI